MIKFWKVIEFLDKRDPWVTHQNPWNPILLELLFMGWTFVNFIFIKVNFLQVDRPLLRPSGIYFDKENSELYVSNYGDSSVVIYQLKM